MVPMQVEDAFAACEELVRRHDPDRYLSALFAPAARRAHLFALYAFNYEIARIAEAVREPMMAEIRLQWWREALEGARAGSPRQHDVVVALAALFEAVEVPAALFEGLVDARSLDAAEESFADLPALEAYGDATAGGLMRIAARVLGAGDSLDAMARAAGTGFAMTGLLRAVPFHAARRKLYLPLDRLRAERLSPDDVFAGRGGPALKAVMGDVAASARHHLDAAAGFAKPRTGLAAIMPAATAPAYLRLMGKAGFDPFTTRAELPQWRRQLAMLGTSLRGRL